MICFPLWEKKENTFLHTVYKNHLYHNNCRNYQLSVLAIWLLSTLKMFIASSRAPIWTLLTSSTFTFRTKLFSVLQNANSRFQAPRTARFSILSETTLRKESCVAPSTWSTASGPRTLCHLTRLSSPLFAPLLITRALPLAPRDFWLKPCFGVWGYVCTLLCALWCFLAAFTILWVFSWSEMEPLTLNSHSCLCNSLQKWLQVLPCLLHFGATTMMNRHEPLDTYTSPPDRVR